MGQVTKYKSIPVTNWHRKPHYDCAEIRQDKRHSRILKLIGQCIKSGGHVIYYMRTEHQEVPALTHLVKWKKIPYQVIDCELHWG